MNKTVGVAVLVSQRDYSVRPGDGSLIVGLRVRFITKKKKTFVVGWREVFDRAHQAANNNNLQENKNSMHTFSVPYVPCVSHTTALWGDPSRALPLGFTVFL